ncbi:uncharacterized protein LOC112517097 isoform X2 [Cynara cardunculus var. scolymus]|uniref:uncharacterized protein LOC112517097 isoform X2 n=1 Tax=Cynara cardunculus var. scolymus TaxID=59895 RepID=UPI000D62C0E2|nr:uncharacterized protein LOC112517097 isoform X2 [Cynara cardunculus var. scolymus]
MEFNFRGWDAQMQHIYHTPEKEGLWSGTSLGGGRGAPGIFPGFVDTRAAIQLELEKERIREEILAEEIARKEAEVRREMAMEMAMHGGTDGGFSSSLKERIRGEILAEEIARKEAEVRREMAMEMAMHGGTGGGFSSSFMLKPPLSHTNRLDPGMPRGQPFAPASFEEKYGCSEHQRREIGSFQEVPFQRLPSSPGDAKKKVIDLGKSIGATLSGAKGKPPLAAAAGSSEWSCAVCKVSATSEHDLIKHLAGKKHQTQMATLKANKAQRHGSQHKTCKKQSISGDGVMKLKKKSAEIGLGVALNTMESKVLKSNKSVKAQPPLIKNSSKCVSTSSNKEDKKSEGEGKKHLKNLLKLHQGSGSQAAAAPGT